jgi:protein-S-isoprenylcysteine O-methyltransferase Ste14
MICASIVLILYWLPMYIIAQRKPVLEPYLVCVIIMLFAWGVYFHFMADLHKTVFLQYRSDLETLKKTLEPAQIVKLPKLTFLKSHLWNICLNPNYLGELLIYASFCCCAKSLWSFVYLAVIVFVIWLPNMKKKDQSLSRFEDYQNFRKAKSKLIPFLY